MIKDLSNQKINKLEVIKRVENDKFGNAKWLCKCECGNIIEVLGIHLRSNHTKSCGCLKKDNCKSLKHKKAHGMSKTRMYKIWNGMKNRTNINNKIKNYSDRGIKLCDEWNNNFELFYKWAIDNGYNDKLTIDRIDVNGNYNPDNCRWVTMKKQNNNKRNNKIITFNGEKHTMTEWNDKLNYTNGLLKNRLSRGWSINRALTTKKGVYNGE